MRVKMVKQISGYVHGRRLPNVGLELELEDETARMLIDSGNAVAVPAGVETASAEPEAAETATKKTATRRRKTTD